MLEFDLGVIMPIPNTIKPHAFYPTYRTEYTLSPG